MKNIQIFFCILIFYLNTGSHLFLVNVSVHACMRDLEGYAKLV